MMKRASRIFYRDGKSERRTFCPCELCRLRFNRMLYNKKRSGEPLRSYWPAGFRAWRLQRAASAWRQE